MKPHDAAPWRPARPRVVDPVVTDREGDPQVTQPSPTLPPAGRYGPADTPGSRRAWVVPAVVLGLLATVVLVWLGYGVTRDPVLWQDVGFSIAGPESIDVTFEVTKDPGATARCRIQALNRAYAEVGVLSLDLGPADDRVQRFTVTLPTAELAVTGTVEGCELVSGG